MSNADPVAAARELSLAIGREVRLARANHGLTRRAAARSARVSPSTQRRVELGDGSVQLETLARVTAAVGLRLWMRAYPAGGPSLRDSGQLAIGRWLRSLVPPAAMTQLEAPVGNGRSVDMAVFGSAEVIAIEIERMLVDFQAQYRAGIAKREELSKSHARPVRLVLVVLDTRRNRAAVREHEPLIRTALPAGSRDVLAALRSGRRLGRDGLAWVRPPPRPPSR